MDFILHPWQLYFLGCVRRQQIQFARTRSARDNLPPYRDGDPSESDILSIDSAEVVCEERLGGVVTFPVRFATLETHRSLPNIC